jgi:plasmid stability protein
MAQLLLSNLEPEILEKLERRAKRLGTTPQSEASRLLRETLRTESEPGSERAEAEANDPTDPRFVRREGFLVFTGAVATEDVPDHRTLREERIESLLKGADEGRV